MEAIEEAAQGKLHEPVLEFVEDIDEDNVPEAFLVSEWVTACALNGVQIPEKHSTELKEFYKQLDKQNDLGFYLAFDAETYLKMINQKYSLADEDAHMMVKLYWYLGSLGVKQEWVRAYCRQRIDCAQQGRLNALKIGKLLDQSQLEGRLGERQDFWVAEFRAQWGAAKK